MAARSPDHNRYIGFIFVAAAALLFWIADFTDRPPNIAHHRLLVASPTLVDDRFRETVILVVSQQTEGSFGFVLNRRAKQGHAFLGGPMEQDDKIYALHTLDVVFPKTVAMKDIGLGALEGKEAVGALLNATKAPEWSIVIHGYSGWDKRQLSHELERGDWYLMSFDPDLVEHTKPEEMWSKAIHWPGMNGP